MSGFVVNERGVVLNRQAALEDRVPIAAWDIGTAHTTRFLSAQPKTLKEERQAALAISNFENKWEILLGSEANEVRVVSCGVEIGQINRRAAAILAPLLEEGLIDLEFQQFQEASGHSGKSLYIYAKLGEEGYKQVIREPQTTNGMRAYVALLACTMKALKASENDPWKELANENSDTEEETADAKNTTDNSQFSSSWKKLPGAKSWDYATGSIGNTVNKDLIDQLGSRTLAALRNSGAAVVG